MVLRSRGNGARAETRLPAERDSFLIGAATAHGVPIDAATPDEVPGLRQRKLPFADRALTIMVFVIVVDVFLVRPLTESAGGGRHWSFIVLTLVLLMGALAIWGNLWITDLFVATSIGCIGARLGVVFWGHADLEAASYALAAANFTILADLIARRVFATGRVNVHRIQGAVAVYLLAGLILGQVLLLISHTYPGAFLLLGQPVAHDQISDSLGYFSFVTLTTVGFGDITPVHPLARSFTLLGAIFGTLYPAILIGRLVSQEMMTRGSGPD